MDEFATRMSIVIQHAFGMARKWVMQADRGQGTVEYALILAFIALVVVAAMKILGPAITSVFTNVANTLNSGGAATPTPGP